VFTDSCHPMFYIFVWDLIALWNSPKVRYAICNCVCVNLEALLHPRFGFFTGCIPSRFEILRDPSRPTFTSSSKICNRVLRRGREATNAAACHTMSQVQLVWDADSESLELP
jgi:hypothetical protein